MSARDYWGSPVVSVQNGKLLRSPTFTRLVLAIYDYLRITAEIPPPALVAHSAKPCLTPDMTAKLFDLLALPDFMFSENEATVLDGSEDHLSQLFEQWYKCWDLHYESSRYLMADEYSSSNDAAIPLLPRSSLQNFMVLLVLSEPRVTCDRLNAILSGAKSQAESDSNEKIILLDPMTDLPFEHSQIPIECFPNEGIPELAHLVHNARRKWEFKRAEVIEQARSRQSFAASRSPGEGAGVQPTYQGTSEGDTGYYGGEGMGERHGDRSYGGGGVNETYGQGPYGGGGVGEAYTDRLYEGGGYDSDLAAAQAMELAARQETEALNIAMATQGSVLSDEQYVWETTTEPGNF